MMKKIYVSEKRVSVGYAYQMLQKGKISFPETPMLTKNRMQGRLTETVELILLGVAVPAVYVSELQDGSWLVLEVTDRLRALFQFLGGKGNLGYMELFPECTGMSLEHLEEKNPRITSMIYDYKLQFQVIDYMTPRYLQLQAGSHVERWNFSREQGVRKVLYKNDGAMPLVELLAKQLYKKTFFFSTSTLNRQYAILRIFMYRFVFQNRNASEGYGQSGIQFLLDWTMVQLHTYGQEETEQVVTEKFELATKIIIDLEKNEETVRKLLINRGKEPQIRRLSYLYNMIWLAREGKIPWRRFEEMVSCKGFWERIEKDDVNYDNIRQHYEMILKDRGNYDTEY